MVGDEPKEPFKLLLNQHRSLVVEVAHPLEVVDQLVAAKRDARKARTNPARAGLTWAGVLVPEPKLQSPERGTAPSSPKAVGQGAALPLLLVVEDDEDDFALLQRACRLAGVSARIRWAQCARAGLAILEEEARKPMPICVVTDVQLPGLNGFEFLALIQSKGLRARIQFAFLTGFSDQCTQDRARKEGADAFFVKPARTEELIPIARALGEFLRTPSRSASPQEPPHLKNWARPGAA